MLATAGPTPWGKAPKGDDDGGRRDDDAHNGVESITVEMGEQRVDGLGQADHR